MKSGVQFVPIRLSLAVLMILAAALFSPATAGVEIIYASAEQNKIDPIVTGTNSNKEALDAWKKRLQQFEECGLCGNEQPFPGDLPDHMVR